MNNNLFYGLVFLSFNYNCTEVNSQEIAANATVQDSVYVGSRPTHFSDDLVRDDKLYTSTIRVDKRQNDEYALSVQMNLKMGAYFVSPNEKKDFSGKFTIVITDSQKISANGIIQEFPLSKVDEKEGFVHLVRKNTHYKQTLKVLSDENFEVYGYLQFTIEPRCTLEKIPFILSYENGKLTLKMDGC